MLWVKWTWYPQDIQSPRCRQTLSQFMEPSEGQSSAHLNITEIIPCIVFSHHGMELVIIKSTPESMQTQRLKNTTEWTVGHRRNLKRNHKNSWKQMRMQAQTIKTYRIQAWTRSLASLPASRQQEGSKRAVRLKQPKQQQTGPKGSRKNENQNKSFFETNKKWHISLVSWRAA